MPKVLLIDDDEIVRSLYSEFLKLKHFDIITAQNGEEGLTILETHKPDLILLDIKMPVMGGIEFLKKMRSDPKCSTIPVVLLTGTVDIDEVSRCFELGAIGYIDKTTSPYELSDKIDLLLNPILKMANIAP